MLHFKNLQAFEKRIQSGTNWADYFKMGGRVYKIYEYGDASGSNYVYFVNKATHDAIKVDYICPSTEWRKISSTCSDNKPHLFVNGDRAHGNMEYCTKCDRTDREKVQTAHYRFIACEFIPNMSLWRTDTL